MLLSFHELKEEVQNKVMTPVPDEHVNASSVDVTLGPIILVESPNKGQGNVVSLAERTPLRTWTYDLRERGAFTLGPGAFVLASTAEVFNLPLHLSAEFRLKSSVARMGLSHALAVWADPGWHGSNMTLELHNITQHTYIELTVGARIGQMIFHRHATVPEAAAYRKRGSYNNDIGPVATKLPKSIEDGSAG